MEIIYWLIPLTLIILAGAIKLFFWAVNDGQFDDLDSEAVRILMEDEPADPLANKESTN